MFKFKENFKKIVGLLLIFACSDTIKKVNSIKPNSSNLKDIIEKELERLHEQAQKEIETQGFASSRTTSNIDALVDKLADLDD